MSNLRDKLVVLGIECGGTRTVALRCQGNETVEWRGGPANLKLLDDRALRRHFQTIAKALGKADAIGIGMAGARTEADWARIRKAAAAVWPKVPCHATNDLETALAAAVCDRRASSRNNQRRSQTAATVLVLSGTGSCCYGRNATGLIGRMGGWGHILGDKGSGFEIGLRALKAVVFYWDRDGDWTLLGRRLLRVLQLNEPNELIGWVQNASKTEIAALAIEVFAAAAKRDAIARDILKGAANSLAKDAVSCACKLARAGEPVRFVFAGSVLLKQPKFARAVARLIREKWTGAACGPLKRDSVWGAVELARRLVVIDTDDTRQKSGDLMLSPLPAGEGQGADSPSRSSCLSPMNPVGTRCARPTDDHRSSLPGSGAGSAHGRRQAKRVTLPWDVDQIAASPTEQRNPRSLKLDQLSVADSARLMLDEDARLPKAILAELPAIEWTVNQIVRAFKTGGRLFYVGAGTSGRLGILDASECPPTFRADPEMVQGIIAGGQRAIWNPVEGAEDDPAAGAAAVQFRGVGEGDVLVGIAASGRTPFVWGALWEAKRRGAKTVLLCFNPNLKVRREQRPHRIIAPQIGPEILTGSTRLKSGTATKLVLNLFTTLAMVRIGKVVSNLMVDVNPSNVKLRDRAVRIVCQLTGADAATAKAALEQSGWVVKEAWRRLR